MRVEVQYLGFLEGVVGRQKETFTAPKLTPGKILQFIAEKYGQEAKALLLTDGGEVNRAVVVLHEGRNVNHDEMLEDGMVIALMLPVAGG